MARDSLDSAEQTADRDRAAEAPRPAPRSWVARGADLEGTIKASASALEFGTLVDGVRSTPQDPPLGAVWSDALVDDVRAPVARPLVPDRRRPASALWIVAAGLLLVILGMQVTELYLLMSRRAAPVPSATPPERAASQTPALPVANAVGAAPVAARKASNSSGAHGPRRSAAATPIRRVRPVHRHRLRRRHSAPRSAVRRTIRPTVGGPRGDRAATAIIDRLP